MKAAVCKKIGRVEDVVIATLPSPQLREDHLRIRVRACALNFPDVLMVQGKYQTRPPLPFAPGMECAGEVIEAGPKAKGGFKVGDRVMAQPGVGCLAEEVCCSPMSVYSIPDTVSYEQAAGFIVTYGTVYHAFADRGGLKRGETLLVLGAAASWAGGNMVNRAAGPVNMLGYVVWSSLFALPPLLVMALVLEGWPRISAGIAAADSLTWASVLWQSVGNTMFGYGAWGWLLARHEAGSVAPLSLLVPVFGLGTSALVLGEPLQPWKLTAFALVMAGLALGVLWPRLSQRFTR